MTMVVCDSCEKETFAFEKFCHECGANRWANNTSEAADD